MEVAEYGNSIGKMTINIINNLDIGEDGKAIGIKRINCKVSSEQWLEYR